MADTWNVEQYEKFKKERAQPAHDADTRVFCYARADVRKRDQADAVLNFVAFWQGRTGRPPEELIFDSKLTTYANLNRLNKRKIHFITLRRRSRNARRLRSTPRWRTISSVRSSRRSKRRFRTRRSCGCATPPAS